MKQSKEDTPLVPIVDGWLIWHYTSLPPWGENSKSTQFLVIIVMNFQALTRFMKLYIVIGHEGASSLLFQYIMSVLTFFFTGATTLCRSWPPSWCFSVASGVFVRIDFSGAFFSHKLNPRPGGLLTTIRQAPVLSSVVGSRYQATASESWEYFMCAVVNMIFGVCNSETLSWLFVVTFYKFSINPITNLNAVNSHFVRVSVLLIIRVQCFTRVSELHEMAPLGDKGKDEMVTLRLISGDTHSCGSWIWLV
jgi:hypothetical protein